MSISYILQAPTDQAAWPDDVPRQVGASASCEAISIIADVFAACRIEGDEIILPQWVQFQLAARLERVRAGTFDVDNEGWTP